MYFYLCKTCSGQVPVVAIRECSRNTLIDQERFHCIYIDYVVDNRIPKEWPLILQKFYISVFGPHFRKICHFNLTGACLTWLGVSRSDF